MSVVGVDLGIRRVAIVAPAERRYAELALRIHHLDRLHELAQIAAFVSHFARGCGKPTHLFIEEAYLSNGPKLNQTTTVGMAEVVATVMTACAWDSATKVSNSHWKEQLTGNGHLDKPEIARWLLHEDRALFDLVGNSQDMVDAACIGIYGQGIQTGRYVPSVPRRKPYRARPT